MANIKSAKKRILVNNTRYQRNKSIKSAVKTEVKKLISLVEASDKTAANAQLLVTISKIDSAKSKGVFHKNTASRKISRLTQLVNKIA